MAESKHLIPILASPEKVYEAVATQKGFQGWWTADTTSDEKTGGKAEFGFDKRAMVFRMSIDKLAPGKQVVLSCHGDHPEWNGTVLTWDLIPQNGSTTLRFTQSGWKAATDFYAACNSTWGELMFRLKDYVEGKNPGPHWKE
ncbi:MAG TPA: SRPBCC domain-containing protein [Candidatus Angelobacter sp.]|nr:SRPBCC domain-containing protein [Candidatus Angelobacter sp.]